MLFWKTWYFVNCEMPGNLEEQKRIQDDMEALVTNKWQSSLSGSFNFMEIFANIISLNLYSDSQSEHYEGILQLKKSS